MLRSECNLPQNNEVPGHDAVLLVSNACKTEGVLSSPGFYLMSFTPEPQTPSSSMQKKGHVTQGSVDL